MNKDFFAAMATITEQVMAQRGVNFDSAFEMCNKGGARVWEKQPKRGDIISVGELLIFKNLKS